MADEAILHIRPEVAATISPDPHVNADGRTSPRRLGYFTFLRAIPGLAAQFTEIPGAFWAQDVNSEGYSTAMVACPCGEEPCIEVGRMEICACGRAYAFAGAVFVANSPKRRPPETPRWQRFARELRSERRA